MDIINKLNILLPIIFPTAKLNLAFFAKATTEVTSGSDVAIPKNKFVYVILNLVIIIVYLAYLILSL